MTDKTNPQPPTGGRDDLLIDPSRCLRMRFSGSSCRRCLAVCPHAAIQLEEALSVAPERCTGCLLCTAECPSGALEQVKGFVSCLAQLAEAPQPVLGCLRTGESSHVSIACLGGLSEEHLVLLSHCLPAEPALNLTGCSDCPNGDMSSRLQKRLEVLAAAGLLGSAVRLATSAQDPGLPGNAVNRRSFFRSLRNSLFQGAAVVVAGSSGQAQLRAEYAGKRVPVRRELLNAARTLVPHEVAEKIRRRFDVSPTFDDRCTRCHACAAICPTGALSAQDSDAAPESDPALCSGCGLCVEFCMEGAVTLSTV